MRENQFSRFYMKLNRANELVKVTFQDRLVADALGQSLVEVRIHFISNLRLWSAGNCDSLADLLL